MTNLEAEPGGIEVVNPFSADQAPGVQVVILMRIYDVLMALLQNADEELHDKLDAIHESGQLAWSLPSLNLDAPEEQSEDTSVPPISELENEQNKSGEQVFRLGD